MHLFVFFSLGGGGEGREKIWGGGAYAGTPREGRNQKKMTQNRKTNFKLDYIFLNHASWAALKQKNWIPEIRE